MSRYIWCEHFDKRSRDTIVDHPCLDGVTVVRVQSWYCPECGFHGAETRNLKRTKRAVDSAVSPQEPSKQVSFQTVY